MRSNIFEAILAKIPSDQIVLKPAISLNGFETYLLSKNDIKEIHIRLEKILSFGDALIQEFLPEINGSGEYSMIFFNRKFSHAIRKLPKSGDFRVHVEHGGSQLPLRLRNDLIAQAEKIVNLIEGPLLFARVDAVERAGKLILMELELLDPMLYLALSEGAPERFASAIEEVSRS